MQDSKIGLSGWILDRWQPLMDLSISPVWYRCFPVAFSELQFYEALLKNDWHFILPGMSGASVLYWPLWLSLPASKSCRTHYLVWWKAPLCTTGNKASNTPGSLLDTKILKQVHTLQSPDQWWNSPKSTYQGSVMSSKAWMDTGKQIPDESQVYTM